MAVRSSLKSKTSVACVLSWTRGYSNFSCVEQHSYSLQIGQEVPGDTIGDEFKGYIFKITGGNDKQGFPMKNVSLP